MFSLTFDCSCRNAESRMLKKGFRAILGLTGPNLAIFPNRPSHLDTPSCFLFPQSCSMTNSRSSPCRSHCTTSFLPCLYFQRRIQRQWKPSSCLSECPLRRGRVGPAGAPAVQHPRARTVTHTPGDASLEWIHGKIYRRSDKRFLLFQNQGKV